MTTFSYILASPAAAAEMALEQETDYGARALTKSLWQYDGKPRFAALLEALVDAMQPIEDLAWAMHTEMGLDTAVGVQLDLLGRIVDEPRGERADAAYRVGVRVKILVNRSNGKVPEIYEILGLIGFDTMRVIQHPPSSYTVEVTEAMYVLDTFRYLTLCKPAGTSMYFVYSEYDGDSTFQASRTYATDEYDADTGAGSVYDGTTGGRSAGVLR